VRDCAPDTWLDGCCALRDPSEPVPAPHASLWGGLSVSSVEELEDLERCVWFCVRDVGQASRALGVSEGVGWDEVKKEERLQARRVG